MDKAVHLSIKLIARLPPLIRQLRTSWHRKCTGRYESQRINFRSNGPWTLSLLSSTSVSTVSQIPSRPVQAHCIELEGSLESLLEQIWLSDVQDTSGDYETRRRGLMVYLHVSVVFQRLIDDERTDDARLSRVFYWSGTHWLILPRTE